MRESLVGLLEKTDLAIAVCRGVVTDEQLDAVAVAAQNVRIRLSYPEDMIVVALAGGTGSGKSSILNVVAGEEVADVGGIRPTTSTPLAVLAPEQTAGMGGYLENLGVVSLEVPGFPKWLVLIDLPDTDSIEVGHRHQVSNLLPMVDVVVWVTDPEKYRDSALHDRFLKPLAAYSSQFLFVLNQTDRLAVGSVDSVLSDFATALRGEGMDGSQPIAAAAGPRSGPPAGIDDLVGTLKIMADAREPLFSKLFTDLESAVGELGDQVGTSLDFEQRIGDAIANAAELIVVDRSGEATSVLTRFVETLATEAGGPGGNEILAVAVEVPAVVLAVTEQLREAIAAHREARPLIRWSVKGDSMPEGDRLSMVRGRLVELLEPPLRDTLSRRAVATAALTDLSLSLDPTALSRR